MSELVLMRKRIDLDASPVLYDRPITLFSYCEDWDVRNASWRYFDDALVGVNEQPAPGVIFTKKAFPGNVLVDFYGQTILPSTHDINVMWNMTWDEDAQARGVSYVAGLQGWWQGKIGIEKSPEYKLMASTPCPWFEPGQLYHIQAGSIDGHCFVFVDGKLQLEMIDPDPIDSSINTRVGFEAYQSKIKITRVTIRQIVWKEDPQAYTPEF